MPPLWRSDTHKFQLPKVSQDYDVANDTSVEDSGKSKRSLDTLHRVRRLPNDLEIADDLEPAEQSIRGYASKLPPYSTSNTRSGDTRKTGRPIGSKDTDFKPYNSAFDPKTAQKLSSIRVTTNAKRFGFRG